MAQILAPGLTAASSSSFTLSGGQEATLSLFASDGTLPPFEGLEFHVVKQASNGTWMRTGVVLTTWAPALVLAGAGTFRVDRPVLPGWQGVGVDLD